jgi:hypothetical protein
MASLVFLPVVSQLSAVCVAQEHQWITRALMSNPESALDMIWVVVSGIRSSIIGLSRM